MPNMSYCRFENTLPDLQDCLDALDEGALRQQDEMSKYERKAMHRLIEVCCEIAENYGEDSEDED